MKYTLYYVMIVLLCNGFFTKMSYAENDTSKHALIIAVGDYPEESEWADISCINDIPLIKETLLCQGFSNDNIVIISDEGAKKKDIIREFESLAMIVKPDDIVVIHFSSHGQQIYDDSGDEIDGLDESIIPWDAYGMEWNDFYQGENHLKDDEIKNYTDTICKKLGKGGNVLMIMDACHSGTATRGGLKISRGTDKVFINPGYKNTLQGDSAGDDGQIWERSGQMAPMVTISGSGQHQSNFEYYDKEEATFYGSLTYAFCQAMTDLNAETTYRELFDRIQVNMSSIAPNQSPQIEGDIDIPIFGSKGKIKIPKPYFVVTNYIDENNVKINAGNIMGVYRNTEVAFYPIGTYDHEDMQPLTKGVITFTTGIQSKVTFEGAIDKETITNTWVYITNQNYGDNEINVEININDDKAIEKGIIKRLKEMPMVNITSHHPDLVIEMNNEYTRGKDLLQVITADEITLYTQDVSNARIIESVFDNISLTINNFLQVNLIKKLSMKDPNIKVDFKIIPVLYEINDEGIPKVTSEIDISEFVKSGNQLNFPEGQAFMFKIKNDGPTRVYFQIIDIKPDNSLNVLLPSTNEWDDRVPEEFVVEAMGSVTLYEDLYVFEAPYGSEYLKLIATREPIDLRMIINSRGTKKRGSSSPLEELISTSYNQTRSKPLRVPPSQATVETITFNVTEKKN